MRALGKVADFGRLVRFSHTVFALPFAVMGAVLAARGIPALTTCALILVAMVAARSAAMAMNRLADHRIDAENPRTAGRELPRGVLKRGEVWTFLLLSCAVFVAASALLNPLARNLSPVALATLLGYPFAKRFTSLCHVWLGAALGLSPVGAWVAVRGAFDEGFLAAFLLAVAFALLVRDGAAFVDGLAPLAAPGHLMSVEGAAEGRERTVLDTHWPAVVFRVEQSHGTSFGSPGHIRNGSRCESQVSTSDSGWGQAQEGRKRHLWRGIQPCLGRVFVFSRRQ